MVHQNHKNTGYSFRGHSFRSQNKHDSLQVSASSLPAESNTLFWLPWVLSI